MALADRILDPTLGPRPAPAAGIPVGLSRARGAVLELLGAQPAALSVAAVAERTGLHPNTAREHLDGLVEAGLVERTRADPVGRGRPAWLYRALPARVHGPGTEYAELAGALVEQLARHSPDPRAEALQAGRRWGAGLARRAGPIGHRPAQARRAVVGILADLRFDPAPTRDATEVRLRACPILDAAKANPDIVCSVHLGIVGGALDHLGAARDHRVDLVPFAEPGACLLTLAR
jgi:predicted ArsR family transcriptional regulator